MKAVLLRICPTATSLSQGLRTHSPPLEASLSAEVLSRAARAGAEDAEVQLKRDIREVEIEGRRMVIEANVVATAAGRPRAAHVR